MPEPDFSVNDVKTFVGKILIVIIFVIVFIIIVCYIFIWVKLHVFNWMFCTENNFSFRNSDKIWKSIFVPVLHTYWKYLFVIHPYALLLIWYYIRYPYILIYLSSRLFFLLSICLLIILSFYLLILLYFCCFAFSSFCLSSNSFFSDLIMWPTTSRLLHPLR